MRNVVASGRSRVGETGVNRRRNKLYDWTGWREDLNSLKQQYIKSVLYLQDPQPVDIEASIKHKDHDTPGISIAGLFPIDNIKYFIKITSSDVE